MLQMSDQCNNSTTKKDPVNVTLPLPDPVFNLKKKNSREWWLGSCFCFSLGLLTGMAIAFICIDHFFYVINKDNIKYGRLNPELNFVINT